MEEVYVYVEHLEMVLPESCSCYLFKPILGGDGRGHIFLLITARAHLIFVFQKLLLKRSAVSFKPVLPIDERRHTCIAILNYNNIRE